MFRCFVFLSHRPFWSGTNSPSGNFAQCRRPPALRASQPAKLAVRRPGKAQCALPGRPVRGMHTSCSSGMRGPHRKRCFSSVPQLPVGTALAARQPLRLLPKRPHANARASTLRTNLLYGVRGKNARGETTFSARTSAQCVSCSLFPPAARKPPRFRTARPSAGAASARRKALPNSASRAIKR